MDLLVRTRHGKGGWGLSHETTSSSGLALGSALSCGDRRLPVVTEGIRSPQNAHCLTEWLVPELAHLIVFS